MLVILLLFITLKNRKDLQYWILNNEFLILYYLILVLLELILEIGTGFAIYNSIN